MLSSVEARQASRWASELLAKREFVVLDSETTGLGSPVGFVEVAVAGPEGKPLLNTTIRPKLPIEPGASKIHGYTEQSLKSSPLFRDIYPDLLEAISGRRVIVYNSRYDRRVFDTEVGMLGARGLLSGRYLPAWECAMGWYSQYVAEPGKRGGYKNQKLPGGDHSALGDCRATLNILQTIARVHERCRTYIKPNNLTYLPFDYKPSGLLIRVFPIGKPDHCCVQR